MSQSRLLRRIRTGLLTVCMAGGTLFSSCGLGDIKDNLIAGALSGVKNSASIWVDGLIPDFNEFIEAVPDNPVDTP